MGLSSLCYKEYPVDFVAFVLSRKMSLKFQWEGWDWALGGEGTIPEYFREISQNFLKFSRNLPGSIKTSTTTKTETERTLVNSLETIQQEDEKTKNGSDERTKVDRVSHTTYTIHHGTVSNTTHFLLHKENCNKVSEACVTINRLREVPPSWANRKPTVFSS